MRLTSDIMRGVAQSAENAAELTLKARGIALPPTAQYGRVQVGGDIGYGTRVTDGPRGKSWIGRRAVLSATAYYLGVRDGWAATAYLGLPSVSGSGREPGQSEFASVRAELADRWNRAIRAEYEQGLADAGATRAAEIERARRVQ